MFIGYKVCKHCKRSSDTEIRDIQHPQNNRKVIRECDFCKRSYEIYKTRLGHQTSKRKKKDWTEHMKQVWDDAVQHGENILGGI